MPTFTYRAYGLNIASDIECPELIPDGGTPDVRVRFGRVPEQLANPSTQGMLYEVSADQFLLKPAHIARFLVTNGSDVIIAAKYLVSSDPKTLALHCFESIDPDIARRFQPGDIVVAGENFGCGSSREHAVLALLGLRAACVIARSYGQIFYRNAFNQGLLLFGLLLALMAVIRQLIAD